MPRIALPGPRNRIRSTWKFMRDPYACLEQWQQQYGRTYLVPALNGDVVVTSDTENVRRVFAAFSDAVGQFATGTVKPLIGENSVIVVEGQKHKEVRSLLMPSFHGETMRSKAETIQDVARRVTQQWQAGQTIRIMDAALDVSLEVIIRVVFGVQSAERVSLYKTKMKSYVSSFHPAFAFSKLLQRPLLGLSPWNKFVKARQEFHELVQHDIDQRRNAADPQDDMLARLLDVKHNDQSNASDDWIRDQLITMLFAGHETTQIAIAWAMSWLHRHPEILDSLRQELDDDPSLEGILKSELLLGICNESLRLNPVVADVIRVFKKPLELVDVHLPAGTAVSVAIYAIHMDPEIYPNRHAFNPRRWSEATYKPYEFLPFGGGIRRCIGASLALMEMKIVIATWIQQCDFSLTADAPKVETVYRRNITLAPRSGIPLIYRGSLAPSERVLVGEGVG